MYYVTGPRLQTNAYTERKVHVQVANTPNGTNFRIENNPNPIAMERRLRRCASFETKIPEIV